MPLPHLYFTNAGSSGKISNDAENFQDAPTKSGYMRSWILWAGTKLSDIVGQNIVITSPTRSCAMDSVKGHLVNKIALDLLHLNLAGL